MAIESKGTHHLSKRRRIHKKQEPYPHPDKRKRYLDKIIYVVGVLGPIMTIPQVLKIWVDKDASGVSGISWFSFLIFAVIWIVYGVVHKEKPIIFTYSLWVLLDIFIIIGIIMYGSFV